MVSHLISLITFHNSDMYCMSYLYCFDKVSCAVGHLFGRLDKVPLGHRVGCFGGGQAAGIAQSRGVLCNYGG